MSISKIINCKNASLGLVTAGITAGSGYVWGPYAAITTVAVLAISNYVISKYVNSQIDRRPDLKEKEIVNVESTTSYFTEVDFEEVNIKNAGIILDKGYFAIRKQSFMRYNNELQKHERKERIAYGNIELKKEDLRFEKLNLEDLKKAYEIKNVENAKVSISNDDYVDYAIDNNENSLVLQINCLDKQANMDTSELPSRINPLILVKIESVSNLKDDNCYQIVSGAQIIREKDCKTNKCYQNKDLSTKTIDLLVTPSKYTADVKDKKEKIRNILDLAILKGYAQIVISKTQLVKGLGYDLKSEESLAQLSKLFNEVLKEKLSYNEKSTYGEAINIVLADTVLSPQEDRQRFNDAFKSLKIETND